MVQLLRSIAVTVEEREPGSFVWRLLEHASGEWTSLDVARRSSTSYAKSMAAGLLALQALIEDLDAGPREEATAEEPKAGANPLASPFGFGTLK